MYIYFSNDDLGQRLEAVIDLLGKLSRQEAREMANIQDIQAHVQTIQDEATKQTTVTSSVLEVLRGLTGTVASLREQLQAAIAANDPAAMQAVVDQMVAAEAAIHTNSQQLADAVTANTPAANA